MKILQLGFAPVLLLLFSVAPAAAQDPEPEQEQDEESTEERLQALEEEQRNLTAHVRELRDPARLAKLAREMGLSRPDHVIALGPPGDEPRP